MKLFVNDLDVIRSTLVKTGAPQITLSDDVTAWPAEVLSKFHQAVPYAGEYDVTIDLSNMDAEARTALGQIVIKAPRTSPTETEAIINKKHKQEDKVIRVPVVIKAGVMSPMDIFVSGGRMYPLTRRRIQRALFRPSPIDLLTDGPGGFSSSGLMMSPSRWQGSTARIPYKFATAILPTLTPQDCAEWGKMLSTNINLKEAAFNNPAVAGYLKKLAEVKPGPTFHDTLSRLEPTAYQFFHDDDAGEYVLRKAARAAFYPTEIRMTRKQALAAVGPDVVNEADTGEGQTVATETAARTPEEVTAPKPIMESGTYVVMTTSGVPLVGSVFTDVRSFDGVVKPIKLFASSDGRFGCMQSDIWGYNPNSKAESECKEVTSCSGEREPKGFGFFVDCGKAYGPCTVIGKLLTPEGLVYRVESIDEGEMDLVTTDLVRKPTKALDGRYLMPKYVGWRSIGTVVPIASGPMETEAAETAEKTGAIEDVFRTVGVMASGAGFSFSGPAVDKLAHDSRTDLDQESAVFIAALLGYHQGEFLKRAEKARAAGYFELEGCLPITPAAEVLQKAAALKREVAEDIKHLRVDLLKEAVFVPDPNSVDAILSLNFINPANVAVFSAYSDDIDTAVQKLAELLLYCRLGDSEELDEDALVSAIRGAERVLEGLETMKKPEPVA